MNCFDIYAKDSLGFTTKLFSIHKKAATEGLLPLIISLLSAEGSYANTTGDCRDEDLIIVSDNCVESLQSYYINWLKS